MKKRFVMCWRQPGALGVPVKRVASKELDAMAHGATHGGVLAVCSAKPLTGEAELLEMMEKLPAPPMLLLLEGVEDARNLGFTLRSRGGVGSFCGADQKTSLGF